MYLRQDGYYIFNEDGEKIAEKPHGMHAGHWLSQSALIIKACNSYEGHELALKVCRIILGEYSALIPTYLTDFARGAIRMTDKA